MSRRWSTKPWIFGSYTYVSVDASGEDYDVLAEPHEDLVFFAGEHTNREHPATGTCHAPLPPHVLTLCQWPARTRAAYARQIA